MNIGALSLSLFVTIPLGLSTIWISKGSLLTSARGMRSSAETFERLGYAERAAQCQALADRFTRQAWPRKPHPSADPVREDAQ